MSDQTNRFGDRESPYGHWVNLRNGLKCKGKCINFYTLLKNDMNVLCKESIRVIS